jgi:hypothetical protein
MKTQLLFLALLAVPFWLKAQPVLQHDNMAPIGFSAEISVGGPVAPGPAGANQIWDFSGVPLAAYGTFEIVDPATTPYAVLLLGSSNYCYKMTLTASESIYDYYNLLTNSMDKMGQNMSSTGGEIFTDPKIDLIFPFDYGESYFDAFAKTNGGFGTVTKTFDAYGTLITPDQTYQNVVRILTVWDDMAWQYQWWNSESVHLLWSVDNESSVALSSALTGIDEGPSDAATFSLSPNPAKDYCGITGLDEAIKNIQLIDLAGKVKKTFEGNQHGFYVNGLVKGLYLVRITMGSGSVITRKLRVE